MTDKNIMPAFPRSEGESTYAQAGMTLRDYS